MTAAGVSVALCPAKVNLRLRVLGRRPDGYHELQTVFQAIDLWDRLEATPSPELRLTCDAPGIPTDGANLVMRAAEAARSYRGIRDQGATFQLHKAIPPGGGLGGGSSDAAAAILLVDRLWNLALSPSEQHTIAASVGADVPFFLTGGTALGTGRGDIIQVLDHGAELALVLGLPPLSIGTAEVFGALPDRLTAPRVDVSVSRLWAPQKPGEFCAEEAVNDLEAVVFEGWPGLGGFRDALLETGARFALLSGSGSTVYGVYPVRERAVEAARRLGDRFPGWRVIATKTVRDGIRFESGDAGLQGA